MIHIENICIQFCEVDSMISVMDLVVKFTHLCANIFNHCQFMDLSKAVEDNEFNDLVLFANTQWLNYGRLLQGSLYC